MKPDDTMPSSYVCTLVAFFVLSTNVLLYAQVNPREDLKAKLVEQWDSQLRSTTAARWKRKTDSYISLQVKDLKLDATEVVRYAYSRDIGDLWLLDVKYHGEKRRFRRPRVELTITNQKYAAELSKNSPGRGWVLTELYQGPKDVAERLNQPLRFPWMKIGEMDLVRCVSEAGFAFTRVEQSSSAFGSSILRAHFRYEGPVYNAPEAPLIKRWGYIDFDPRHSYRPVTYRFNIKTEVEEGIVLGTLEYEDGHKVPVLKVVTEEVEIRAKGKGLVFGKDVAKFSDVEYNGHVPAEEFRLSYYGLPEPRGIDWQESSYWYLWFIAAAVAALAVGAYFRYRAARRRKLSAQGAATSSPEGML